MDMAQNILVIKTVSGMAMAVAAALDASAFGEICGMHRGDRYHYVRHPQRDNTIIVMEKI